MAGPKRRPSAGRASAEGTVAISVAAGCLTAVLSRPGAGNRMSAAMARALGEAAERVEDDDAIRVLAITGLHGAFCAGFDDDIDPSVVETIAAISKPTVAVIDGPAIDSGMELALGTDIRIASAAARFAIADLERGRMPRFGATQRLPRLVGVAHAMRILLAGAEVAGREAMRLGLVTYYARDAAALGEVTGQVLSAIATRGPIAARLVKEAVTKGYDMTLDQGVRLEEDLYALLQTTADRAEGIRAFLEKRKPLFRGV